MTRKVRLCLYRKTNALIVGMYSLLTVSCAHVDATRNDLGVAQRELSEADRDLGRATSAIESWLTPDAAHGVLLHISTGGRTATDAPYDACSQDTRRLLPALVDLGYQAPWDRFCSYDDTGYSMAAQSWSSVAGKDGSVDGNVVCYSESYVDPQNHARLHARAESAARPDGNPASDCSMAVMDYKDVLRRRNAALAAVTELSKHETNSTK